MANSKQRRAAMRYWRFTYWHDPHVSYEKNLKWHIQHDERTEWCKANIGRKYWDWSVTANGWHYHFHKEKDAVAFTLKWA